MSACMWQGHLRQHWGVWHRTTYPIIIDSEQTRCDEVEDEGDEPGGHLRHC